ncbi:hypothetical protein APUTEX25_004587 [Auxenochlorella protothecoides]|uniref:Uncharacterized protein n=1 Tax=Auxenochlorella protothecoides TaxID=3075 RepID=A0A3M7L076_AUXPR|nr:hypothetical protein APUTEX25_004587 [Auxenochlorella protothecoides]|eukprot:RMZ56163.1 hypothetical protein APUTEX25_004587 [Auxenochlorella protothecoides]
MKASLQSTASEFVPGDQKPAGPVGGAKGSPSLTGTLSATPFVPSPKLLVGLEAPPFTPGLAPAQVQPGGGVSAAKQPPPGVPGGIGPGGRSGRGGPAPQPPPIVRAPSHPPKALAAHAAAAFAVLSAAGQGPFVPGGPGVAAGQRSPQAGRGRGRRPAAPYAATLGQPATVPASALSITEALRAELQADLTAQQAQPDPGLPDFVGSYHSLMGPPTVGYSVSPMQDVTLEALLSASTPRHSSHLSGLRTLPAVLVESSSTALVHVAGGGRLPSAGGPSSATHVEARSTPRDVLEDLLPFALDGEASSVEQAAGEGEVQAGDVGDGGLDGGRATPQPGEQHGGGGGGVGGHPGLGALAAVDGRIILCVPSATQGAVPSSMSTQSAGAPGTTALALPSPFASGAPQAGHPTSAPPSQDSDAAVGAFVRLLRDAPPLQACGRGGVGAAAGSGGPHRRLTVAAGLARLQSLQDRLARQAEGSLVA